MDFEILKVDRLPSGVLDIARGEHRPLAPDQPTDPIDPAKARVVTIDHSVALAGIDSALFGADDALSALHWGLPAAVLLIMALMIKLALWPVMQTNRLRLSLKRLELLVVQSRHS